MPVNYLDNFSSPEEFIRSEILANRGSKNVISKAMLVEVAGWKAENGEKLERKSKEQLLDMIIEQYGVKAYSMFPIGVNSINFQIKFGIRQDQVKKLVKAGVITVTGERKFRMYGRDCYAKVYSPYDYFRLTFEEVHKKLAELEGKNPG